MSTPRGALLVSGSFILDGLIKQISGNGERFCVVLQNLSVIKTGAAVIHELGIVEKELGSMQVKLIYKFCFYNQFWYLDS